jgi:hypothetical protein
MHDLVCKACTDRVLVYSVKARIPKYTLDEKPSIFIRDKPIFSSEKMLHKDYYRKSSVGKKIFALGPQGAWRQDELIGSKQPVVK